MKFSHNAIQMEILLTEFLEQSGKNYILYNNPPGTHCIKL